MSRMFRCTLFLAIIFAVNLVSSKPTDQPTKLSLETPDEILDNTIIRRPSRWERSMDLLGQIMDSLRIGRGRLVNFAMMAKNIITERAEEFANEASNTVAAVLAAREARRIIEEVEGKKAGKGAPKKVERTEEKEIDKIETKRNEKRSTIETSSSTPIKISPLDEFLPSKTRETVRLETESGQSLFEIKKELPGQNFLQSLFMPTPLVDRIKEEEKYGNSGDKFIGFGRALVNGFEGLSNFVNTVIDFPVSAAKKTSRGITAALNQVGGKLVGLQ